MSEVQLKDNSVKLLPAGYHMDEYGITEIIENPDTGGIFYTISFPVGDDKKTVTLSGEEVARKNGMMKLAGYGALITDKCANELSKYLMDTIKLNYPSIPKSQIFDTFGWKADGFVLGNLMYTIKGNIPTRLTNPSKLTEAIKEEGTIEEWVKAVSRLMNYDSQRFKMYVAVVPLILKILNADNCSLNDFGESSIGKTLSTRVAMSIYGDPDELIKGDATKVGAEMLATRFSDLPIVLDDAQNLDSDLLNNILYMIASGVGKLRGAKDGGMKEAPSWRTFGLCTSEAPIKRNNSFKGLDMRLIEVSGGLGVIDNEAVSTFEAGIKEKNYGVFAPILIEDIIKNPDKVKEDHKRACEWVNLLKECYATSGNTSGMAGRIADIFISIQTAGYVFERLYGPVGGEVKDPEGIIETAFEKAITQIESENYMSKGLGHIMSWLASTWSSFLKDNIRDSSPQGKPNRYKISGNISKDYYDILPTVLKEELDRAGFSIDRLMADLKEAGILQCDKNKTQRTARIEGTSQKVYRFIRQKIDSLEGL